MSADNGVYVLNCKGQYRVAHLQAIDNLYWSFIDFNSVKEPVSTRVVSMFKHCKSTHHKDMAYKIAVSIYKKLPVCEYGIQEIVIDKSWGKILHEAYSLAAKELKSLESKDDRWDYDRQELLEIVNSYKKQFYIDKIGENAT